VHLRRGELEQAGAVLRRGVQELIGDRLRSGPLLAALVEVELRRGDVDEARAAALQLSVMADGLELPWLPAESALAEARLLVSLGDLPAAIDAFGTAKRLLADDDRPLLLGVIRIELAEALSASGDRAGAISEARAALAAVERLGAAPARDRASSLLRDLGETGRSRPAQAADLADTLTRREVEVLQLIRDGLTNAGIAERLYISPKTAEHHVSRILAKLGLRSRAEAAAYAARGRPAVP
jgi:DNA-binding NarL/FixJ family response regulator